MRDRTRNIFALAFGLGIISRNRYCTILGALRWVTLFIPTSLYTIATMAIRLPNYDGDVQSRSQTAPLPTQVDDFWSGILDLGCVT